MASDPPVTRFKDIQDAQKLLDQMVKAESLKRDSIDQRVQEQLQGINKNYENLTHTLADIQLQLLNLSKDSGVKNGDGILGHNPGKQAIHTPTPKVDFPRFDGTNARAWMLQCYSYFKLMPSVPDSQRVHLAALHFDGRALSWYQTLDFGDYGISWSQFLDIVSARFEGINTSSIIVEFNKLKQTGSYEAYVDKFDELKTCLLLEDAGKFSEEYFVASFLSGLSEELQSSISMFKPTTLVETIELGKKQIHTLEALARNMKPTQRPFSSQSGYKKYDVAGSQSPVHSKPSVVSSPRSSTKLLTAAEMSAELASLLHKFADVFEEPVGLPPGLLQPLPIPHTAWTHISLDFVEGLPKSVPDLPITDEDGSFLIAPLEILGSRVVNRRGIDIAQVRVCWVNSVDAAASWEDLKHLLAKFPSFDPWGQGSIRGGGIVMAREELIAAGLLKKEGSGKKSGLKVDLGKKVKEVD